VNFNIPVDAGSADYFQRAAQQAIAANEDLVVVMNTPGGLLGNLVHIIDYTQEVQNHGLAVYTYVPPAAFAASAGSYIALASNAIYMGNGSVIGPSTPYIIGGDPSQIQHVQNFATGLMRSLAEAHGYNVAAAVDMAQNNTAYTGMEAARIGLVTGMADTLDGFLTKVGLSGGSLITYNEPLYDQFLSFLSDPTVDGLFILVGMIALVLDLFHRTLFVTVVAVIMIALGFLGAGVIGAQPVAILVLLIAAALIFIEVKAGHGLFALTGISLGLFGTYLLAYGVQWSPSPFGAGQYAILGVVAGLMAVAFIYLSRIRRILMRQPKLIDPGLIVNKTGRAATDIGPGQEGVANVGAEDWTAVSDEPIERGAWVQVTSYAEGKVHVRRAPSSAIEPKDSPESSKTA
jgi:membrane-bound serine protease (ClpP class)